MLCSVADDVNSFYNYFINNKLQRIATSVLILRDRFILTLNSYRSSMKISNYCNHQEESWADQGLAFKKGRQVLAVCRD